MNYDLLFVITVFAIIPLAWAEPIVSNWVSAYWNRPVPAVEIAGIKETKGTYVQWFDPKGHLFDAKFIPETWNVTDSEGNQTSKEFFHPYDVACNYGCPYDHNRG